MQKRKLEFRRSVDQYVFEFLRPLRDKAITQFSHAMTFGYNQITSIGSSIQISNYFNKRSIPIFCADESGRFLDEGIYLNQVLESTYPQCAFLFPFLRKLGKKFKLNYGKHSLHIVKKEQDCQHLFTFHFDLESNAFLHWSLNNGQFIHDLIERYEDKAQNLIITGKELEIRSSRINFDEFQKQKKNNQIHKPLLSLLHKQLNVPVYLSQQQTRCLILLTQGMTLKRIAQILNISPRTVETHLEKVRDMLSMKSCKELVSTYFEIIKHFETNSQLSNFSTASL